MSFPRKKTTYRRKRANPYNDRLTGGTGDVNPQILNMVVPNPAAHNAFQQTIFNLPVSRLASSFLAIEILKIWLLHAPDTYEVGKDELRQYHLQIGTRSHASLAFDQPDNFFIYVHTAHLHTMAAKTSDLAAVERQQYMQDYTDGAGHGIVVASDHLYVGHQTALWHAAHEPSAMIRILYRFKSIPLTEYLGVIQSQIA